VTRSLGAAMGNFLVPTFLLMIFSVCSANAIELKTSNHPADHPFEMAEFAAPEGVTKDEWRKIKSDIVAELPKLTRCQANLDKCTSTEQRFADIVREAENQEGLAKIALINATINALIDYEPDRNQWGVADKWTAPFVNKKGAFETGHGDCEDYALAKYVALRQAGMRSEDVRMVLVHDNAVRVDHAILAVRYDKLWLVLDNRWDKLVEDKELIQFKPLAIVDANGVTLLAKQFTLSSKMAPSPGPVRGDSR
jgi:predicted transglutaminase-like cysteine proteinase